MISVIDLIGGGLIADNRITISPELIARFTYRWKQLVTTPHQMIFALPFFHMRSEPFWQLAVYPGSESWLATTKSLKSLSALLKNVAGATIDEELYLLLADPPSREALKSTLLSEYFPHRHPALVNDQIEDDLKEYEYMILSSDPEDYRKKVNKLKSDSVRHHSEEEIYVRNQVFRKIIPGLYGNQCAVSGIQILKPGSSNLIDACHIVPFSVSADDTAMNGISLTPTLHRAFDRGLIGISDNYRVIIRKGLKEIMNSPYNLSQFEKKEIILPDNPLHRPSPKNLRWHRDHFGL